MTSKERLYARMAGKSVDKIPNMNIVMGLVAKMAGATYREYVQDYRKLVDGNLICAERFGFDSVGVISDPMRETSAYGTNLHFPEDGVPYADPCLLADGLDISRIIEFDPLKSPRTLDRIKGVELLRQKVGTDYPVIGWVEGVLAETADLRGVNELMYDLAEADEDDDDNPFRELMDFVLKQQCRFALEQIKAGADIIGVGNAVASLIGPRLYEEYGLKYDIALTDFIHENGAKVKLHICGNITAILPYIKQVSPDILDIDWMVDFKKAAEMFRGTRTCVCGNMDPVSVMLQGDSARIKEKVFECAGIDDPTVLVAAGCEIPVATPEENLLLMDKLLYQ